MVDTDKKRYDIDMEVFEEGNRVERITNRPDKAGNSNYKYLLIYDTASKIDIPTSKSGEKMSVLDIVNCGIETLDVPGNIYMVSAFRNEQLKKMSVADVTSDNIYGAIHVHAGNNSLEELKLGKGVEELNCSYNKLESLEIPEGCKVVKAKGNQFKELKLPESCEYIDVSYNPIENLNIPENSKYVIMNYTNIKEAHIPENCEVFECTRTPLDLEKASIHPKFKGKVEGLDESSVEKLKKNYKPNSANLDRILKMKKDAMGQSGY